MLKSYGTNVGAGTTIGLTAHETAQVLQGFWQSLNARKQQAGNLKSEAAEDSKKENAATLMASCIHNILGIVDRINELQEKEKHIGKFITIKQHEDWWKQVSHMGPLPGQHTCGSMISKKVSARMTAASL